MVINALNSAEPRFMADFEDATGRSGSACVDTRNFGSAFRHSNYWIQRVNIRRLAFVLAVSAVLSAASTQASSNLDAAAIRSQQQIRADAEARTGRYKDMPDSKRNDLFRRQGQVEGLLGTVQSTTELDETRRIQLFKHLEAISAIINAAEDERMICKRTKPVGSNRPTTVCKTVAQRRDEREAGQTEIQRRDQR